MRDGRTRRVESHDDDANFLARHRASLTILTGPAAGSEFPLESTRLLIGRSSTAEVRLEDPSVSHEHAAMELGPDGFGIRDLASTNGLRVNGAPVESTDLKHGDRLEIGSCELQYVIEAHTAGRTWQLDDL
jgi:S-DNA-T family DNA segregation ATPase FtsK/SpoIIIE